MFKKFLRWLHEMTASPRNHEECQIFMAFGGMEAACGRCAWIAGRNREKARVQDLILMFDDVKHRVGAAAAMDLLETWIDSDRVAHTERETSDMKEELQLIEIHRQDSDNR